MAWNYRKRVKIAPGVHLNIGKKGVSTTVGLRGASMTFGKNGTYVNTGIPGTGFYKREKIGGKQVTPTCSFTITPVQSKQYSHGEYVMGFCACIVGVVAMFFGGMFVGGFLWWVAGIYDLVAGFLWHFIGRFWMDCSRTSVLIGISFDFTVFPTVVGSFCDAKSFTGLLAGGSGIHSFLD